MHPAAPRTSSSRRARCAESTTDDVRDLRGAASSGANGPAELLRRGVLMLMRRNASACTGSASFMPAMLKLLMRPSALDIGATISSSGSAARSRAKGMPIASLSTTAEPEGASMASCSSSSWKRHTQHSGSPGATEKPASGVRSRRVMPRRSRASSAYPSAAPPFMRPNRMMTTSNSSLSFVMMSPKLKDVRSLSEHIGMDGFCAPAKSVKWRHAHCVGPSADTQPAPRNACRTGCSQQRADSKRGTARTHLLDVVPVAGRVVVLAQQRAARAGQHQHGRRGDVGVAGDGRVVKRTRGVGKDDCRAIQVAAVQHRHRAGGLVEQRPRNAPRARHVRVAGHAEVGGPG